MKLLRFIVPDAGVVSFGVVLEDCAISFAALAAAYGKHDAGLADMAAYIDGLPQTFAAAQWLCQSALEDGSPIPRSERHPLDAIRILPPIEPPALYDFALAPVHLLRSARTLLHHELPRPLKSMAGAIASARYSRPPRLDELKFYVGSPTCLSGPGDTIPWPDFTAYLDVEPEVAVVTASIRRGMSAEQINSRIAGYCIFNDLSARDVQFPEMSTGTLGFMRTKHFDGANGLGPFLVTPDEVGDARDLAVTINIGNRLQWKGATHEYLFSPEAAIGRLSEAFSLPAGCVVGLGTVPGCCGLDNDEWARPGERVTIDIEYLGTLTQTLGIPQAISNRRWPHRSELAAFYAPADVK